jgi:hypothetical protein
MSLMGERFKAHCGLLVKDAIGQTTVAGYERGLCMAEEMEFNKPRLFAVWYAAQSRDTQARMMAQMNVVKALTSRPPNF